MIDSLNKQNNILDKIRCIENIFDIFSFLIKWKLIFFLEDYSGYQLLEINCFYFCVDKVKGFFVVEEKGIESIYREELKLFRKESKMLFFF